VDGGEACNVIAGFNWYLRRKVRFMVNYVHAYIRDRANPHIENDKATIIMSRFQLAF
jgi:phosphate-selective porin